MVCSNVFLFQISRPLSAENLRKHDQKHSVNTVKKAILQDYLSSGSPSCQNDDEDEEETEGSNSYVDLCNEDFKGGKHYIFKYTLFL